MKIGLQTGVFSATVAAFLIESYKYLKPDPTDVSSTLLQQVTQELAGISIGDRVTAPTLEAFKPPRFAINVNILWFSSLCMSLSCGLGATLVQQWVRRYFRLTQRSETPTHRVRIRTFLFAGIEEFQVRLVVENISLLLHAAILLFFAGLVEFLFAINDEVAHYILAVICYFVALYIALTALPVIFQRCPFQTPLTSVFWYMTRIIPIIILFPFTCSGPVRNKIKGLWTHTKGGFDTYVMNGAKGKKFLDKEAVRMTLSMCRGDSEVEAFLDAVPSYLQIGDNVDTRIDDIGSLLNQKRSDLHLGHQIVHLFSSCINGDGKMDEVARRRRAVTCSHAVFELSKAISTVPDKGSTLEVPKSIGHKLQHLSRDRDPKIALAALRTIAVLERALLDQLVDADGMDWHRNFDTVDRNVKVAEVLAAAIGEDDPASTRYQPGLRNPNRSDGRLIAVTEFMSSIVRLIKRPWHPSHQDIEDMTLTFQELCRDLNGRDFSHTAQERFVDVLSDLRRALSTSWSTGTICPEYISSLEYSLTSWCPLSR